RGYLQTLGFKPQGGNVDVDIQENMEMPGTVAWYDEQRHRMVIDAKYAADTDLLLREYSHRVLYSQTPVDTEKATNFDQDWAYYGIESALATYLPCSFQNKSSEGEISTSISSHFIAYHLENKRKFAELKPNMSSARLEGIEVWGGAFWEMRGVLGRARADKLLLQTWFDITPADLRNDKGAA